MTLVILDRRIILVALAAAINSDANDMKRSQYIYSTSSSFNMGYHLIKYDELWLWCQSGNTPPLKAIVLVDLN